MKSLQKIIILAMLSLCMLPVLSFAQTTGSVRGKITDVSTGEDLPSATVILIDANGKKIGRITKKDGTFEFLGVDPGNYTMRVNYIGYKIFSSKVTIEAGKELDQSIKLQTDVRGLDEVVIVGEASTRYKSDAEVAVSKVDAIKESETNSYEDISQLIAGKVPGVKVSSSSGNVGGGVRFDVRSGAGLFGSGQPVIYVDGVRVSNGEFGTGLTGGQGFSSDANINPNDIADIEILHGPAASALYGTSGSNGVVLIKTKKGLESGGSDAPNYIYTVTTGVNEQAQKYTAGNGLNFDAANAIFQKGTYVDHYVSLNGNNPLLNYYVSFDRRNEDGIMHNNSFERNSVRLNLSAFPTDKITINANTNFTVGNTTLPQNDNNILGFLGETVLFGPRSVGGYGAYALADSTLVEGVHTENANQRFLGSLEGLYRPTNDLQFRASFGFDGGSNRIDQTWPANLDYSAFGVLNGERYIENASSTNLNADLSGQYSYKIGNDLSASTMLGTQFASQTAHDQNITKQNFPTNLVTNVGAGQKFSGGDESFSSARDAGIFLAEDLSWSETYLFSLGVRNDYASSVGANAPSIFYPRASGAVRFDKLDILPQSFDLFKFRVAYGQSGILPGPLDGSGLRWAATPSGSGTGAIISFIGNPDIKPERTGELELGLELEYLNSYGIDFTYFNQNASNSIVTFINAPSTGLTSSATPRNVGAIKGSGFEASIYATPIRSKDYQLDLNLIWSYATNTVTSLGGAPPIYAGINAVVEGQPRAAYYTYAVRGALFNPDGTFAGSKLDTARSFLGNPVAPTNGSFSIRFKFLHDFTLTALADWSIGGTINNLTRTFQAQFLNDKEYNSLIAQLGLQSAYGLIDSTTPALKPGTDAYKAAANRFAQLDPQQPGAVGYFESSDFLRIREVGLRYDFTTVLSDLMPGRQIKSLSVNLGVRNLGFIFKKYSGPDIDVNSYGSAESIIRGIDFLTLQNPRVFFGTVSIGF